MTLGIKEGQCYYCMKYTTLRGLRTWNHPDDIRYYCKECLPDQWHLEREDALNFLEYYKHPEAYKHLSDKGKVLYQKTKEKLKYKG